MSFIKLNPTEYTHDFTTTNVPEKQLWQELVMIRHLDKTKGINAKTAITPCIDQAKIYFLDAYNSEWRASGLLYYYSFLNLAKAFIVAKKGLSAKKLQSASIYHGLSANPQAPTQIIDFEIQIHPPSSNGRDNIFSIFYQKLMNEQWPHTKQITIKFSDILPYTRDISVEVEKFYNIKPAPIYAQSLVREVNNSVWFEINVPSERASIVQSHINNINFTVVNPASITDADKADWLTSYYRTANSFRHTCFMRTEEKAFTLHNRTQIYNQLSKEIAKAFYPYVLPFPTFGHTDEAWQFIPRICLTAPSIRWHPLLSDYLFAFILSTILRYHPHLLQTNKKDSFLAEAWCAQSAITSLRYFLMAFTTPSIRFN